VNSNVWILALVLGFHLEPAWALLLIVIAVVIKIFPAAVLLELFGPVIINAINRNRGNQNGL
jgi:hypothetical protein